MHPRPAPSNLPSGWHVVRRGVVGSTQDELEDLFAEGPRDRWVVVAERQHDGRGRGRSAWESPPGGLWCSLSLLRPGPPDPFLGLLLAGAVLDAVRLASPPPEGTSLGFKWPNDLWLNERKWGGILTDVTSAPPENTLYKFGLGLNLDVPLEALPVTGVPVTSLLVDFGNSPSPDTMLSRILSRFDERLARDLDRGRESSRRRLERDLVTKGRIIRWRGPKGRNSGRALGLELDGALRVQIGLRDGPITRLYADTIEHVRAAHD